MCLKDVARPILSFPENSSVSTVWEQMLEKKEHISILIDEYGCFWGIVTMEDILEELVGEIWDEHDEVVEAFQEMGEGVCRVACTADFEQMRRYFQLDSDCDCTSVSGWVMEQLGRIPHEGDRFYMTPAGHGAAHRLAPRA